MQMRYLGACGPSVSCLALGHSMGASDFSATGRARFNALIARALELGVTFFDSSDAYWNGLHEQWLGAALGSARKQVVVTSEFGNLALADGSKATDARPAYVIASLGAEALPLSPWQFDALIREEMASNAEIIKAAGIKPE